MHLFIGTDGGASKNGQAGATASWGFAAVARSNITVVTDTFETLDYTVAAPEIVERGGDVEDGPNGEAPSNNRGELTGFINALQYIIDCKASAATIFCDSKYTIMSVTVWSDRWLADPKKHKLDEKANMDLIMKARGLLQTIGFTPDIRHVRGHKKPPAQPDGFIAWFLNNRADRICCRYSA